MSKENKLVPELRFREFKDEDSWTEQPIEKLCDVLNNLRKPVSGEDRVKGMYPYYGASGIVDYVNDFIFNEKLLLVGEDGAKWGAYEKTAFIVKGKYWVNNHAHVLRPKNIVDVLLENYLVKLDISKFITGAAPPKLTLGKLKNILVPVPTNNKEQQKIADCLSSLDDLITAENEKLDLLKNHKKGLMQQLFPAEGEKVPKLRFPEFNGSGEWEDELLEDVSVFLKGKGISKADINAEGYQPCIRYGELYTTYTEIIDKVHSFTNIPIEDLVLSELNDVIIPSSGETQADIATASCVLHSGIALGGDLNIIRSNINGVFMAYYLSHNKKNAISKMAQGNAVVHLYSNQLKKLGINFPKSKIEQQKIADCLSSLDDQISLQTQKNEDLKLHKKGLMQQLFPIIN